MSLNEFAFDLGQCQNRPSTNTAVFEHAITVSGVPGRPLTLHLWGIRLRTRNILTTRSGFVALLGPIRAMSIFCIHANYCVNSAARTNGQRRREKSVY